MPVFSRIKNEALVLTADGDYTPNELRRVGFKAFESAETPTPTPVILDLSGAAGLGSKSTEDLAATGAIFGAFRDRIAGLAVVVPPEFGPKFDAGSPFALEAGGRVRACQSHASAIAWLAGPS